MSLFVTSLTRMVRNISFFRQQIKSLLVAEALDRRFHNPIKLWVFLVLFSPVFGLAQEKNYNFTINTSASPGIEVALGEEVKIEAQGSIMLGFFAGVTTPGGIEGYRSYNIDPSSKHGALLYKIGNGSFSAMNAPSVTFKAKNSGELHFVVNDNDPSNNSGYFDVRVTINSSSSLATDKNIRKKGFVYKSDAYWSRLGSSNPALKNLFEGNFNSIFKDENFESLFTAFVENYSKKCNSYIPGNTEIKIRTTESGRDAYGSHYSNSYISHTFKVDPEIADIFLSYLNKQEANALSDYIGVFASNSSPTAGDLIAGTFQQPVNALISMRNFFNTETCDCATMNQMKDNFYRFALDRNSVQQDNIVVAGAERESHN